MSGSTLLSNSLLVLLFFALHVSIAGAVTITPTIALEGEHHIPANVTAVCSYGASDPTNSIFGALWSFEKTNLLVLQGNNNTCTHHHAALDSNVFFCDADNQTFKLFLTNVTDSGSICCGIVTNPLKLPQKNCAVFGSFPTQSPGSYATQIKTSYPVVIMAFVSSMMMEWMRVSNDY